MVGKSLGHLHILRKLGQGGMGEVYLAEDTRLGRQVAVKLLPEELTLSSDRRARFQREARAVATLSHPNIVAVHSVEEIEGRTVLVLEYVRGKNLAELIPPGGFGISRFLEIALPLSDAVAAAHRGGVIHRDLKPGNVMVDQDGRVKVLDFGLARIEDRSDADDQTVTGTAPDPLTTEEGRILGTVAYMSPEQLEGRALDHRTDIFSLGVLLYEMSTGRRPFRGDSRASMISSILRDQPPSVSDLKMGLPRHLSRILRLCLAKDPDGRYQTALDVRNELALLKEETESGEVEVLASDLPAKPVNWKRAAAFGVPLLAALAVLGFLQLRDRTGAGTTTDAVSPPPGARGTALGSVRRLTYSGGANAGTWSPNGDEIVYTVRNERGNQTMVVPASGGTPRILQADALAWNWTPDGKSILAMAPNESGGLSVLQIDRYGAPPRVLREGAMYPDLSPDGRTLAYYARVGADSTGVWTVDLESGERRLVVGPPPPGKNFYKPQWSPTGDRIAYSKWTGSGHEIWIHDMERGTDRKLESGSVHVGGHYDWTHDGRFIATAGSIDGIWSIWMIPLDGSAAVPVTQGGSGGQERHASVSPDGRAVVFVRTDDASRIAEVDLENGDLRESLRQDVSVRNPSYTPDGLRLVFQAVIDGRWQIWSGDAGGGTEIQPVVRIGPTWSFQPTVLPDGSILHLRAEQRPVTVHGAIEWDQMLWISSADGGRHRQLAEAGNRVFRIAPGGFYVDRWLVSVIDDTGAREKIVWLRDGEDPQVVWEDGEERGIANFDWGRTGDEMVLTIHEPGENLSQVSVMDLGAGTIQCLLDLSDDLGEGAGIRDIAMDPRRGRVALVARYPEESGETRTGLFVCSLPGGELRQVRVFPSGEVPASLRWSQDGRYIAFHLSDQRSDLYVWEAPGRGDA